MTRSTMATTLTLLFPTLIVRIKNRVITNGYQLILRAGTGTGMVGQLTIAEVTVELLQPYHGRHLRSIHNVSPRLQGGPIDPALSAR